ncbi:hypothetical protein M2165_000001 [Variovorax sp. TBS-050B]|uniref:hypothetical protein n=1 Tax=Variovorax sp. TBS-050B TaxID=2940551 RepID=UPI0024733AAF|nr:hypothetical protein [Variovorax sp. TBS-050B]MDH6590112.1 hypothetical protein [Variovorax sp. TBS-050B]
MTLMNDPSVLAAVLCGNQVSSRGPQCGSGRAGQGDRRAATWKPGFHRSPGWSVETRFPHRQAPHCISKARIPATQDAWKPGFHRQGVSNG